MESSCTVKVVVGWLEEVEQVGLSGQLIRGVTAGALAPAGGLREAA
jgi:hypothetical protein